LMKLLCHPDQSSSTSSVADNRTCSCTDNAQQNLPTFKAVPRLRTPVTFTWRSVARVFLLAAKVTIIIIQIPRLICALKILY